MTESFIAEAIHSIQSADEKAELAQLAFVAGSFNEYFEREVAAARSRVEERQRELTERFAEANAARRSEGAPGGSDASLHGASTDGG